MTTQTGEIRALSLIDPKSLMPYEERDTNTKRYLESAVDELYQIIDKDIEDYLFSRNEKSLSNSFHCLRDEFLPIFNSLPSKLKAIYCKKIFDVYQKVLRSSLFSLISRDIRDYTRYIIDEISEAIFDLFETKIVKLNERMERLNEKEIQLKRQYEIETDPLEKENLLDLIQETRLDIESLKDKRKELIRQNANYVIDKLFHKIYQDIQNYLSSENEEYLMHSFSYFDKLFLVIDEFEYKLKASCYQRVAKLYEGVLSFSQLELDLRRYVNEIIAGMNEKIFYLFEIKIEKIAAHMVELNNLLKELESQYEKVSDPQERGLILNLIYQTLFKKEDYENKVKDLIKRAIPFGEESIKKLIALNKFEEVGHLYFRMGKMLQCENEAQFDVYFEEGARYFEKEGETILENGGDLNSRMKACHQYQNAFSCYKNMSKDHPFKENEVERIIKRLSIQELDIPQG